MATAAERADGTPDTAVRRRRPAHTAAKWAGFTLLGLLLLVAALFVWINSDPGRRFVVKQINDLETASGLDIDIGRIEGSLFGDLVVHDLRLRDPRGTFFYAPTARLDYRPLSYFRNRIDIQSLEFPQARLSRLPELRPGDPDAPLLPDINLDIGRLHFGRLLIGPAVTGQRHILTLDSRIKIDDGRAQVGLNAATVAAPGIPGGDRLVGVIDAVPEENKLDLRLRVRGPEDGLIAGLAGLDRSVDALIEGRGSWADWQGRARAALGDEGFANLAITARNGTFSVQGPVRIASLVEGPLQRLVGPLTQVDLTAALNERRADLRLRLNSRAAAVAVEGLVDLGENQFQGLRIAARLLQPGAIAPDLRGSAIQLAAVLNGPFATPTIAYDLRAGALGFGETVIEGLRAQGRARVRENDILLPVEARARRVLGLDPSVGGLLTNVTVSGDLGITGPRIVSDNLRVRSDRLNGTVAIALDLARGRYLAAVQGQVNNYQVDGVGLLDIETDLEIVSDAGGFGLQGRFAARTRRIDNEAVRDFLGGRATVSAGVNLDSAGVIRLDNIRLASPQLRITSGSGVYRPDGRLDFTLRGVSEAYGALSVRITGTATSPQVELQAATPGFGIGLRDVQASVRATAQGWAIQATGQSQYGPFSADVVVMTGGGPLTIQVNRLTFAGIDFAGRVTQTPSGVFEGTLTLAGQGLDGTVQLGAFEGYQRVAVSAVANGARIPGETPILIERGIIRGAAILYPDAPEVVADVQVAGLRSGTLQVAQARGRANYRGGSGQVQLVAEGSNTVPFEVAVNAALTPERILAAARGEVNSIPFRLARPAEIRQEGGTWRLDPTTVLLSKGRIRVAGSFGDGLVVQTRLDTLDLSIFNAINPDLGLGGTATGSLDFAQPSDGSFPRAEARLTIDDFTRTGVALRSEPVTMALAGALRPEGGALNAVIRRRGNVVGRAQVRLQPLGPAAGSWTERLMAAPLSGGVRYNGPASVLTSLAAIPGHQVTGPIGIAADFSGRLQDPDFTGVIRANSLTYVNEQFGTRITDLAMTGRFAADQLQIVQLTGRAGEGTVRGEGTVGLAADAGFPIDIQLAFDRAQLARSDDLGATVSGTVAINNSPGREARISGDLQLPEVRYQIVRQAAAELPQLAGVRRRGEPLLPPDAAAQAQGVPSIWNLDLRVRADNRVFVSGMGLESEWETDLTIGGTSATPRITGNLNLIRGTLSLAGRRFQLANGDIRFTGSRPPNPLVDIQAVADIDGVQISINVGGSATSPQIAFSSSPGLPQDEIVSRILFGSSVAEISALQAVQVAASLNSLRGGGGGLNPLGKLQSATGIDRLRILGADETTGRGTAVAAGKYISDDIYVEIITDTRGFTATQIEVALSRTLSLLSQFGGTSGSNATLRYSKDY